MNITITNGGKGTGEWCDRRSVLGNPFPMRSPKERDLVCDAYQEYFDWMIQAQDLPDLELVRAIMAIAHRYDVALSVTIDYPQPSAFRAELQRLAAKLEDDEQLTLKCWCAPKRCHCLSIAAHLLPEVGSFSQQLSLGV